MRLYEITYNGRKWETTSVWQAWIFFIFMLDERQTIPYTPVKMTSKPYEGEEIPNIQVA